MECGWCLFALCNEHVICFPLIDVKLRLFSSKIGWIQPKSILGQIQTCRIHSWSAQIVRFGWTMVHAYGHSPQLLSSKVKWSNEPNLILWRFWYNICRHVLTCALFRSVHTIVSSVCEFSDGCHVEPGEIESPVMYVSEYRGHRLPSCTGSKSWD
jgi:hypothetical protein